MSKKTNEIRKRIQFKEEKLGRSLTKQERQKIEKSVIRKYRRENFIRGAFLAIGITIGAGGHALLTAGNNPEKENNKTQTEMQMDTQDETTNPFKDGLKVEIGSNTTEKEETEKNNQIDYEKIMSEIIEEYNEKYDTKLSEEDISFIKSNPQYLGVTEDGTYIQDYKQKTPVKEHIRDGVEDIYVIINNKDNTIISSLGKVDRKITNIDTKVVMAYGRKEYFESDKKIDLTKDKNEEEVKQIYEAIQNEYEKDLEEEKE